MPESRREHEAEVMVQTARSRFRAEVAASRAELEALRSQPLLSDEEKRQLTDIAARGEMGREMQEFARDVERGEGDWESFVRRQDGRDALLQDLVHRAESLFTDEVREALLESEPPPGIDDPRPHPWPPYDPGQPRR